MATHISDGYIKRLLSSAHENPGKDGGVKIPPYHTTHGLSHVLEEKLLELYHENSGGHPPEK